MPISLSDSELAAVMDAAKPIPARDRDRFLHDVAPIVRARPAPALADLFILGVAPIDYSPILLLKPFGFRIAPDTLSSEPACAARLVIRLRRCRLLSPPAGEALPLPLDTAPLIRAPEGL